MKDAPSPSDRGYGPQGIYGFMIVNSSGTATVYRNYQPSQNAKDPNLVSGLLTALNMFSKNLGKLGENGVSRIELEGLDWIISGHGELASVVAIDPAKCKQKKIEAKIKEIVDYLSKHNMLRDTAKYNDDAVTEYVDKHLGFNHDAVLKFEEDLEFKTKSAEMLKKMADIEKNTTSLDVKLNKSLLGDKTKSI